MKSPPKGSRCGVGFSDAISRVQRVLIDGIVQIVVIRGLVCLRFVVALVHIDGQYGCVLAQLCIGRIGMDVLSR